MYKTSKYNINTTDKKGVIMTKYVYLSVLQGHYGYHGWEDLDNCETKNAKDRKELKLQLKEFRMNDNTWNSKHRIVQRRVLRKDYFGRKYEGA